MTLPTQAELKPKTAPQAVLNTTETEGRLLYYDDLRGYGKSITSYEKNIRITEETIAKWERKAKEAEKKGDTEQAARFRAAAQQNREQISTQLQPELNRLQNELGPEAYAAAKRAAPKHYTSGKQGTSAAENKAIRQAVSTNYAVTQANAKRESIAGANYSGADGKLYSVTYAQQQPTAQSSSSPSSNVRIPTATSAIVSNVVKGKDNTFIQQRAEGISRRSEAVDAYGKRLAEQSPFGRTVFSDSSNDGKIKGYARGAGQAVYAMTLGLPSSVQQVGVAADKTVFAAQLKYAEIRGTLSQTQKEALGPTRAEMNKGFKDQFTTAQGLGGVTVAVGTVFIPGAATVRNRGVATSTPKTLQVKGGFDYPSTTTRSTARGTPASNAGVPTPKPRVTVEYELPLKGALNRMAGRKATVTTVSDASGITTTTTTKGNPILQQTKVVEIQPIDGFATRTIYRGEKVSSVTRITPQKPPVLSVTERVVKNKTPLPESKTAVSGEGTSALRISQVSSRDFALSGTIDGRAVKGIGLAQSSTVSDILARRNSVTVEESTLTRGLSKAKARPAYETIGASKTKQVPQILEIGNGRTPAVETINAAPRQFVDVDRGAVGFELQSARVERGALSSSVTSQSSGRFKLFMGKEPKQPRLSGGQRQMIKDFNIRAKEQKATGATEPVAEVGGGRQQTILKTRQTTEQVSSTKVKVPEGSAPSLSLRTITEVLPKTKVRGSSSFLPAVTGSLSGAGRLSGSFVNRRSSVQPQTPIVQPPTTAQSTRYQFDVDIRQPTATTPETTTTTTPRAPLVPTRPTTTYPNFPGTTVPSAPFVPMIAFPSIPGASGFKFPKSKARSSQRKAYTPSAFALALNIRGKRPGRGAITSGLGLRPILK